jgi:hypothetical protein
MVYIAVVGGVPAGGSLLCELAATAWERQQSGAREMKWPGLGFWPCGASFVPARSALDRQISSDGQ